MLYTFVDNHGHMAAGEAAAIVVLESYSKFSIVVLAPVHESEFEDAQDAAWVQKSRKQKDCTF